MAKRGGGWGSWGGGDADEGGAATGIRAVIRQILEVVPGGILRAGKTVFGAGSGWWIGRDADGAGKVDIGSPTRYLRFDGTDFTWASDHTSLGADGTLTAVNGYFSGILDAPVLELEFMRQSYTAVSWAQFAIYDGFADESRRASADPSEYAAVVARGRLWNGGDTTAERSFGFCSKAYNSITTVRSGTSTAVGVGYLEDAAGTWFVDQYKGYELVAANGTVRTLTGCTLGPPRLWFSGTSTPAEGVYHVRGKLPTVCVGFLAYRDSSNGGYGSVKFEASFDHGAHWLTIYETGVLDRLEGIVAIAEPGRDYECRVTLTNDIQGRGAEVYKLLFCTDPSVWG